MSTMRWLFVLACIAMLSACGDDDYNSNVDGITVTTDLSGSVTDLGSDLGD
jgi:hypothetical protein